MSASKFNLVDEPWIGVRMLDGTHAELSLRDAFHRAGDAEALANDAPTQDFAILRVMLAVLHRAVLPAVLEERPDYAADAWGDLWDEEGLPLDDIDAYLDQWHDRFNLFDDEAPFMQVAGLEAANGAVGEVAKIIADVPDGDPLFTMRAGAGAESLSYREAARWLVHVHAFDTSGIKSGVVGDPGAKGGKSYPIGTGWAGMCGGVYLSGKGGDLSRTLLLNLVLTDEDGGVYGADGRDLPAWERPQCGPAGQERAADGPVDLYTWQSRRVRLVDEGGRVTGAVLSNGDRLEAYRNVEKEPMTAWKRSKNLEKKLDKRPVYFPLSHRADKALWRGLTSILTERAASGDMPDFKVPRLLEWAGTLACPNLGGQLDAGYPLRVHAVGFEYGTQSATVSAAIDDVAGMQAFLFAPEGAAHANMAKERATATDVAVRAFAYAARRLATVAGADDNLAAGAYVKAAGRAYFELDAPFREWLAGLGPGGDVAGEAAEWNCKAHAILLAMSRRMVEGADSAAVVGREISEGGNVKHWVNAAGIEAGFEAKLNKVLPREAGESADEEKEEANGR